MVKILQNVTTIFDDNLISLIKKDLEERVIQGQIGWEDAYADLLDEAVTKLSSKITLTKQDKTSKIDKDAILEELSLAKIYLSALNLESKNIDKLLGDHELLRKDDVKTVTDIRRRYLDIVNHSEQEFKTTNIEIKDGKIRLFPVISQSFNVHDVSTTYAPSTYIVRVGNDPTVENISPGTDSGFWEATVFTKGNNGASASVTLDFKNTIAFNRLRFNSAGKFPITITNVETEQDGAWTSIHTADVTSKNINIVYSTSYQTSRVRITATQSLGEYTWWTKVDNRRELIQDDTAEEAADDSFNETRRSGEYTPVVETVYKNVHGFQVGAYNIILYLDIFAGDANGIFYSRNYTSDTSINSVKLSDELVETKPGSSTITYSLIQQDGSRVDIIPGQDFLLTKTFTTTQNLNTGVENWVTLDSAPLTSNIATYVNGELAARVTEFSGTGALEYIISGHKLFFSTTVFEKTVATTYTHKTNSFIIEIKLNNGTTENQFETPTVENFGVVINGSD